RTIARASTVAVVVPSPATSLVLVATSLASWAPMFSHGSSSSISLAIVTPSLVIVGAPHFLSRTTLWPFGPSVRATVSASLLTPASSERRASSLNFRSLDAIRPPFQMDRGPGAPRSSPRPGLRSRLLLDDGEDVARGQDQVLLARDLDLGAAVLRVEDLVPDLHVQRDPLPVLEPARAHRDDLPLLGLLLGRVGNHDPGRGGLLLLARLDDDPILEGLQAELCHSVLLAVSTQPM